MYLSIHVQRIGDRNHLVINSIVCFASRTRLCINMLTVKHKFGLIERRNACPGLGRY